jgi:V/A-type H+-transporting ATPase subunit C
MPEITEQPLFHFTTYPAIGKDDWRYIYATAEIRAIEDKLLGQVFFAELAGAKNIKDVLDMLSGTDYAVSADATESEIEQILARRRSDARKLFERLINNEKIVEFFQAPIDFANMRLAIRRLVLEKPLDDDYCDLGGVSVAQFESAFSDENYGGLPEHLQEGVEAGVLGYYKNKNIRDIDFAIDKVEADFLLSEAMGVGGVFLEELFRIQTDLLNIRTMIRMKYAESQQRNMFFDDGYIEPSRLTQCLEAGYDTIVQNFLATPYQYVVEAGAAGIQKENSFTKLEAACDAHFVGFLKTTRCITAGTQPIIAYLLLKEQEIKMMRMVLACKRAQIESKIILDRLAV